MTALRGKESWGDLAIIDEFSDIDTEEFRRIFEVAMGEHSTRAPSWSEPSFRYPEALDDRDPITGERVSPMKLSFPKRLAGEFIAAQEDSWHHDSNAAELEQRRFASEDSPDWGAW